MVSGLGWALLGALMYLRGVQLEGYEFVECRRCLALIDVDARPLRGSRGDGHGLGALCRRGLVHRVTLVSLLTQCMLFPFCVSFKERDSWWGSMWSLVGRRSEVCLNATRPELFLGFVESQARCRAADTIRRTRAPTFSPRRAAILGCHHGRRVETDRCDVNNQLQRVTKIKTTREIM